jgi:hypothetical protein
MGGGNGCGRIVAEQLLSTPQEIGDGSIPEEEARKRDAIAEANRGQMVTTKQNKGERAPGNADHNVKQQFNIGRGQKSAFPDK